MDERQTVLFVESMIGRGWQVADSRLVSPEGGYWFNVTDPWPHDLEDFRVRMLGRLERCRTNNGSTTDVAALAEVLDGMCEHSLVEFFEQRREPFDELVARHRLRLMKFYLGCPAWSLVFRHPRGGVGKLELIRESETNVNLWAAWWIDNHARGQRRSHSRQSESFHPSVSNIRARLGEALRNVASWTVGVDWKVSPLSSSADAATEAAFYPPLAGKI